MIPICLYVKNIKYDMEKKKKKKKKQQQQLTIM